MTTGERTHVSAFALDVFWASGRSGDPAIDGHVAGCGRCRAYLESLDALRNDRGYTAAPPGWPARSLRARTAPALPWLAFGALGIAACVALLAREKRATPVVYLAGKGAPGVQVLVHRAGDTHVWDGRSAVRPGDSLALRVACEGLEHVAVAAPGRTGWARLSNAECSKTGDPLPFTLVVDADPGEERLAVVLSRAVLDDGRLRHAIANTERTQDVWVADFNLRKEPDR